MTIRVTRKLFVAQPMASSRSEYFLIAIKDQQHKNPQATTMELARVQQ